MHYNLHSCVLLSNQVFVPVPVIVISSEPSLQTSGGHNLIKIGCFTDKNPVSLYFSASKVPNEGSTKVPLAVHDMQLVLDMYVICMSCTEGTLALALHLCPTSQEPRNKANS